MRIPSTIKTSTSYAKQLFLVLCAVTSGLARADIYLETNAGDEIRLSNHPVDDICCVVAIEEAANLTDVVAESLSDHLPDRKMRLLPFNAEVTAAAKATDLDPALLHAVIATESQHDQRAVSPRGARGLMQLMPVTARRFAVTDAFNPHQNIMAGARYLRELKDLYGGNLQLALAAYNAGPEAVNRYGKQIPPFRETRSYVPKVMSTYLTMSKI